MARNDQIEQQPTGVHFVGSVPLSSTEDVFRTLCTALPNHLLRIPDGETGKRDHWIRWQRDIFASAPNILREPVAAGTMYSHQIASAKVQPQSEQEINHIIDNTQSFDTLYDQYAIESYAMFCRLRAEGIIPAQTRFQVSLPTPLAVVGRHIIPPFQARIEQKYEDAMLRSLEIIQNTIPHSDLAIQWDIAFEIGMLESVPSEFFKPWFSPLKEGIIDRIIRLVAAIKPDVEVGLHLCYGDVGGKHFVQPKDTGLVVEIAKSVLRDVQHPLSWIHLPVPKDREDIEYFMPLSRLVPELRRPAEGEGERQETKIFLGLVHPGDKEGTMKRISAAKKVIDKFGVATECGMGRFTREDLKSIVELCANIAVPVRR